MLAVMNSLRKLLRRSPESKSPDSNSISAGVQPQNEKTKDEAQSVNPISREGSGNDTYNQNGVEEPVADAVNQPGELTFAEDTAGGMGRHLGLFSCTFLMLVFSLVSQVQVSSNWHVGFLNI